MLNNTPLLFVVEGKAGTNPHEWPELLIIRLIANNLGGDARLCDGRPVVSNLASGG